MPDLSALLGKLGGGSSGSSSLPDLSALGGSMPDLSSMLGKLSEGGMPDLSALMGKLGGGSTSAAAPAPAPAPAADADSGMSSDMPADMSEMGGHSHGRK